MRRDPHPAEESPESTRHHDVDWLQYAIIVLASFAATMALYELLIKRLNLLRILFGLKPRRPGPAVAAYALPSA
ncbi:MAG TPA: hypothetical protein VLI39_14890 [Sedimentisphaerales bacterium]|nr:hypothetical protein [Sedimentisphaerales bacterium]